VKRTGEASGAPEPCEGFPPVGQLPAARACDGAAGREIRERQLGRQHAEQHAVLGLGTPETAGDLHGVAGPDIAHLVDEEKLVRQLQREKYGWQMRLVESANTFVRRVLRRPGETAAFIEVVPDEPATES